MRNTLLTLNRDEIRNELDYPLICETMCGNMWNTNRRRKLYSERFDREEQKRVFELKKMATKWYLETGAPEKVQMSQETYDLWQKLAEFCSEL